MSSKRFARFSAIACALIAFVAVLLPLSSAAGPPAPTFNRDVAPIIFKHCANCHRSGEIAASMPLTSYEEVQPLGQSIKEAVVQRTMPPWPADPDKSVKFRNDPRLSQQEIDTLVAWIDAGAPKGDGAPPPLPAADQGWLHPGGAPPDLVVPLPTYHIPATGEVPYVRFLAKVPFPDDKWISAIQVRPSNRAVVHHMAITEVSLPNGMTPDDVDRFTRAAQRMGIRNVSVGTRPVIVDPTNPSAYDMLAVYTPGTTFEMYEDGSAKLLKGGTNVYLNINIHYQPTGKPEIDKPELAFWFQPQPPKHPIYRVPASGETIIANGKELMTDAPGQKAEGTGLVIPPIPPFADNYELIGITGYTQPVTIYQFQPHAHLRGKDFQYTVVYPDGREENLVTVPHYQFHWQLAYEPATPVRLPAGSKLVVTAHYDNSMQNHHLMHGHGSDQTGPDKEVLFREQNQSWDEMFTPFIQYSIDSLTATPSDVSQKKPVEGEQKALEVAQTVGCLQQTASGAWMLDNSSAAVASKGQATSSQELTAAVSQPLGSHSYPLLGVGVFQPSESKGHKVAVKGVLIEGAPGARFNVTSLQSLASSCR